MKNILLFLTITLIFSCGKEQPIKPEEERPSGRITNVVQNVNGTDRVHISLEFEDEFRKKVKSVIQYQYRSDGTLSWKYKLGFEYNQNDIVIFSEPLSKHESRTEHERFMLNDQNQIETKENSTIKRTYKYDESGYLSHIEYYENGPYIDLTYTNNNMTSMVYVGMGKTTQSFSNRTRPKYIELLIDPEQIRWLATVPEHILYEQGYFGKITKNQLASITYPNQTKTTTEYGYSDDGQINKVIVSSYSGVKTFHIVNE